MRVETATLGLSPDDFVARPFLASMGIYLFKYDLLERLLAEEPGWVDFGREVIPGGLAVTTFRRSASTDTGRTLEQSGRFIAESGF